MKKDCIHIDQDAFINLPRAEKWKVLRSSLLLLADIASVEAQREISLKLNNECEESGNPSLATDYGDFDLSEASFLAELEKLPGLGEKSSQAIAEYIALAQEETVFEFARALVAVNRDACVKFEECQMSLDVD